VSDFIDAVATEEIEPGVLREIRVDGHDLLVARVGDDFYVSDAHCPHLHGNLTRGTLEGTVVTCPVHGSQFDLTDGRCVRWTAWSGAVKSMAEFVRHSRPLRVYDVVVEEGRLLGVISIGDLVKYRLDEAAHEVDSLREYVMTAH